MDRSTKQSVRGARPTRAELALAGAAAACVLIELLYRLGPLDGWPGGTPLAYSLAPAAIIGIALWYSAEHPDRVRTTPVLVIVALEGLGFLLVHRWLGPDDGEIAVLYERYGRILLDSGHLPVAEYPPFALALFGLATALGPPPVTVPLLTLPLLLACGWVICRLASPAAWCAAAVLLWPGLLGYWEIRFDAAAAGLLALGIFAASRERWALAGALLAAGAGLKWYPAVAMIPLVVALVRGRDWAALARSLLGFASVAALTFAPS